MQCGYTFSPIKIDTLASKLAYLVNNFLKKLDYSMRKYLLI